MCESNLQNELQEILEKSKPFPFGPAYKSIHKQLAKLSLDSDKEDEAIEHLVESHVTSLHMRAFLKYDMSRCAYNGETHVLDGLLVQSGGVPLLDRLRDMPEEWSLVHITYAYGPEDRLKGIAMPTGLHIVRFVCGEKSCQQPPYCITVPILEKDRTLSSELCSVLDDHQKKLRFSLMVREDYYKLRSTLNLRMKSVVQKLQSNWLGPWTCLFVGHYVEQSKEDKLNDFVDNLLQKYESSTCSILKNVNSRDVVRQLAKASTHLPEWDLSKALAQFLNIPNGAEMNMARDICRVHEVIRLETSRRHPVILLLDEELEMFPWEMLTIILDHTVCRMPSLQMLHALYTAHKSRIVKGRLQVDVGLGYFIVNPQQNLPCSEKRLRTFLRDRIPSWVGTFGIRPTSEDFKSALEKHNVFMYSGHGCGSEFLQGDEIQKLNVQAVTFLFGCSSVTSKDQGGRSEPYGIWHFYQLARCPMVVGNLWSVPDVAADAITIHTLNNWLPPRLEMQKDAKLGESPLHNDRQDPELLYAIHRSKCSLKYYMATAALVFRGLPVTAVGSIKKAC